MSQLIKHPGASGPFGIPAEQALVAASAVEEHREGISLGHYLEILRRRKWLVLAAPVVVAGLVALDLTAATPLYRSTARLQIDPEMRLSGLAAQAARGRSGANHINTQLAKMTSPALAGKVIAELDLVNNEGFTHPIRQGLFAEALDVGLGRVKRLLRGRVRSGKPATPTPMTESMALKRVRENLSTARVRDTNLIAVSFSSPDRQVAAAVANAMAEAFIEAQLEGSYRALSQATTYLERQLGEVRQAMAESTRELAEDERGREVLLEGRLDMGRQKLSQLNGALAEAEGTEIELEAAYEATRQAGLDTMPEVAKDKSYRSIEARFVQLSQQLALLRGRYGPQWPAVRDVSREIEQVEQQLWAEKDEALRRIGEELRMARSQTARLRGEIKLHRQRAADLAGDSLEADLMIEEAELNRKLYDDLLARLKQTWVAEGLSTANIRFVESARAAGSQFTPNKTRSLGLALLFGLSLGVVLAFVRELSDNTLTSSEDVNRHLKLPALGVVPSLGQEATRGVRRWLPWPKKRHVALGPLLVEMGASGGDTAALEAYRSLRTSILLSHSDTPPQTILVTSALPGEGKSTTALNVASSLAQAGQRTVLVELDLRKPGLEVALGLETELGISGYLSGNCNLNSQIQGTYLPQLFFVGCGAIPPNPPELIGSKKMQQGLDLLREYFVHIVIDSPPVLGLSDALLLSRQTDGVVLVARGGKTPRQAVGKAAALFAGLGARLLGVLINDLDATTHGYGYGYGYGYAYGYRYGYGKDGGRQESTSSGPAPP